MVDEMNVPSRTSPGTASRVASVMHCETAVTATTKAMRSAPSLSATETGRPNSPVSGLIMAKLDSVSVVTPWVLVWNQKLGTPAACNGSQTDSPTADWLTATATTSSSTNWFAQSAAPPGSPRVSHGTTSTGRPPTPPRWVFQYSAVASAMRSSSVLSVNPSWPSETIPMRTGSPDASSSGPSSSDASDVSSDVSVDSSPPASSSSSPPHAASSNPPTAATASIRQGSPARRLDPPTRLPIWSPPWLGPPWRHPTLSTALRLSVSTLYSSQENAVAWNRNGILTGQVPVYFGGNRSAPSSRMFSPLRYGFRAIDSTRRANSSGRPMRLGKTM